VVTTEERPDVDGAAMSRQADQAWTRYVDMRQQAQRTNSNAPDAPSFTIVVAVPRADITSYHETPWLELRDMAKRQERGLSLIAVTGVERASSGYAWMRDCRSAGMLKGRACLYSQGW
jgi:hypothetical protein